MTIKLDGKPLSDFGIELLSPHVHPAAPQTRDITLEIPGRHGLYHFGSTLGQRNFSFECGIIRELDTATLQQRLRQFVAFLLDAYGKPREIRLTFDYEADKYYAVKFAGDLVPERFFSVGSFALPFVAYDPMAKFIVPSDEIIMDTDIPVLSDITLDATYTFAVKGNTQFDVINDGTAAVRPDITIEGTADNIVVWNTLNGKTFFVNAINSTIEISGENYSVKQGGVSTLSKFEGEFLELMPGSNPLVITADNANLTMTFKFSHKYL